MALTGNLSDLGIAELIQLHCQSGSRARLLVRHAGQQMELYFADGEVVHAQGQGLQAEEAAYALLAWEQGDFEVQQGVEPPAHTIRLPWSALVLEGLRRKDESEAAPAAGPVPLPADPLEQILRDLAAHSSFQGMMVVGRDGAALATSLPPELDPSRATNIVAGLFNLSSRSTAQLARGDFLQTLIQGAAGNLIITQAGPQALLLALADLDTNLGLAFLDARESAQAVAQALDARQSI
ncbi:MAG: DUF4388 domain-containing protein [Chloroflexota bacterium]